MNCCDDFGDCHQGRNCPARKCPHCHGIGYDASGYACTCTTPAKVAKVGKRMRAAEPIGSLPWRAYLKDLARSMLIVLAVIGISAAVVGVMRWPA